MGQGRAIGALGIVGQHIAVNARGVFGNTTRGVIDRIRHVVVIMQENRSFDSYFGTFPGADGLPTDGHGHLTSCVPDPRADACDRPFHDPLQVNGGASHNQDSAAADIDAL